METKVDIHSALLEAQRRIHAVKKSADNPYFSSKYATLEACIAEVKPILNELDIYVTQVVDVREVAGTARDILITTLHHVPSGTSKSSSAFIPISPDIQRWGSALTYLKRYELQAITFLPTEDDDANASVKKVEKETYTGNMAHRTILKKACKELDVTDKDVVKKINQSLIKDSIEVDDLTITNYVKGFTK